MKHWDILPLSLKAVAFLFIIGGVMTAAMSFTLLLRDPNPLPTAGLFVAIIGPLTGIGLLWLNPGWKKFALVIIFLSLVVLPLGVLGLVMNYLSLAYSVKQASMQQLPPNFQSLLRKAYRHYMLLTPLMGGSWFVQVWAYWVLNKPAVRRLFGESDR